METEVNYSARQIKEDLRQGRGPYIRNRRTIAGLSIFSTVVLGGIALYQVGICKRLPQPVLPRYDAEKVNGSNQAYAIGATPDALLGMASYSVTACLAGMGPQDRWKTARWIPLAMLAKLMVDASMAGKLSVEQWTKFRAFSFWSLLTSAATFSNLGFAIPEVLKTFKR